MRIKNLLFFDNLMIKRKGDLFIVGGVVETKKVAPIKLKSSELKFDNL